MKKFAVIFIASLGLTACGCSQRDSAKAALALAMHDIQLVSAHDIKHYEGGLREQVDELFFRADPAEFKEVLAKAGFVRDDSIPAIMRGANSRFKELVGSADMPGAIGFRRADLTIKDGKYCHMVCAGDFSWAYVIYVDSGTS